MSADISREQWLKALSEADTPPVNEPGVLTRAELGELFGLGRAATLERLAKLVKAGKAVQTWKWITVGGSYPRRVPAYRLVQE